ncbi:uncharacterized protein LOC108111317 [Drosophila eugracilis]|uniref:uncharacterized protein LOC108111317 n=1 Tax=Drosophila eugracilis TaxID=29029 RepID=UPI0007E87979|nr:uncharacterized protein LOC108111317 [Drosophila eugracilis]
MKINPKYSEIDFLFYQPKALRPVLFLFYVLETALNLICMAFHIRGYMSIDMEEEPMDHIALIIFSLFMAVTSFQSIAICTGSAPNLTVEIVTAFFGSFAFVAVSLGTMWDVQNDIRMLFLRKEEEVRIELVPFNPIFNFMRAQSMSSLACGIIYLLHASIMIDVKLTTESSEKGDELPIPLFVLGRSIHSMLYKFEWFREFCGNEIIEL